MIRIATIFSLLLIAACEQPTSDTTTATGSYQQTLQQQLIMAKPGDVIEIPEGTFEINRALSLKIDNVTVKGAGMDKSVLSFKKQAQGAEGMIITGNNITLEDFAVEDTKGDAIKINECTNLVVRRVRVEWTGGPDTGNGAYGLYPVQCQQVLIDGAVAIGASDAGIYVGQSDHVIVKNSRAEYNVAGIEIENTTNADVFDNIANNNTGGILVFNMPNLDHPGYGTRVFNNEIHTNNTGNFAIAGTAVAGVPAGSGVVINSNDKVEIFNNRFADNDTANIIISSFFSTGYSDRSTVESFDPYPEAIYIYGNSFEGGGTSPDGIDLKALRVAMYGLTGELPDVLWDGFQNDELLVDGSLPEDKRICIPDENVNMLNADGPNDYAGPTDNLPDIRCELPKLPAVELAI